MKKIINFILSALVLASCLPFLEHKSGLIAYIGTDWNIYVMDQSGGNPIALTEDAVTPEAQAGPFRYYQYPTWSPESNLLAFVGISGEGGAQSASDLFVADLDTENADKVYTSETE